MTIPQAVEFFMPIVSGLMRQAEATGAKGVDKQAAVAAAAEVQYKALQGSVKELRAVPWELVAPLVVSIETGVISTLATMFNRLMGRIWTFIRKSDPSPAPAAG